MKKYGQFVLALLITRALVLTGTPSAIAKTAGHGTFRAHEEGESSGSAVEARDLPIEQYLKLKTTALSNAKAQTSLKISNPRVSTAGLDPALLAILEEQQRYLRTSDRRKLQRASMLRAENASAPFLCTTPVIAAVNGRTMGAVFTPRLGYNHYRIEGCGFGRVRGDVRLVPDSPGLSKRPITLRPEGLSSWSDRQIDVRLDPHLAGVPDLPVTLAVQLADGRQLELSGCRFIAVRGRPVALKAIPSSWVKLNATGGSRAIPQLEYVSPPTGEDQVPGSAASASALVIRSDSDLFGGGSDTYQFSGLNAGWVVASVQIQKYSVACPGDVTRLTESGDWNATFNDFGFSVRWASTNCSSFIPPTFRFSMAASEYAVTVWATGPIGTEPIANVRGKIANRIRH